MGMERDYREEQSDEELKVLIKFLWDNNCNVLTAAHLLNKKGVTTKQFKRVTEDMDEIS